MISILTRQGGVLGGSYGLPHDGDCLDDEIKHLVERGNNWWKLYNDVFVKGDWNEYINGNIEYSFEFVGSDLIAQLPGRDVIVCPLYCRLLGHRDTAAPSFPGIIGVNCFEPFKGMCALVYRWEQKLVFVDDVELMDQGEHYVASEITVGCKLSDCTIEPHSGVMGQSLLNGSVKTIFCGTEGELNGPSFPVGGAERRDYLPVGMIEGGPKIMDNVTAKKGNDVHSGFVLFTPKGALSGLCICFKDKHERSRFAEKLVKIKDVFRGLTSLQNCAV
jgi:hypothetical protein